jgi:hypothetical protein
MQDPPKFTQILIFGFENIPSGNPGVVRFLGLLTRRLVVASRSSYAQQLPARLETFLVNDVWYVCAHVARRTIFYYWVPIGRDEKIKKTKIKRSRVRFQGPVL